MSACAPKPMVAPMIVALARSGVRSTPSIPRMIAMAPIATANRHALASTAALVDPRERDHEHDLEGSEDEFDEGVGERSIDPGLAQEVVNPAPVAADRGRSRD